jgi:hypothetical protein
MPTWGELLEDLKTRAAAQNGQVPLDDTRKDALALLAQATGRPVVMYASRWIQGDITNPQAISISLEDLQGFMEVLHGVSGPSLDLILHSGGGSPTAAEAIIEYVRTKFSDLRVIVPLAAMSAATMMACAANRIVLGKHSYLGPIDPQLLLQTPVGVSFVPAQAILEQFKMAQRDSADKNKYASWIPMLQQYGPALLVQCKNVMALSQTLVSDWLARWMFAGHPRCRQKAGRVARSLNKHQAHLVHGRHLSRAQVRNLGLIVDDLETNQAFQDAVLTAFHATMLTFQINPSVHKVIENHLGKRFMKLATPPAPTP